MTALEILMNNNIYSTRGETRRAIQQNAVKINGVKIENAEDIILDEVRVIQSGRRKFLDGVEWMSQEIDPMMIVKYGKLTS